MAAAPLAYFKLKNSASYRFWRGRRLIDLVKGVVHSVSDPKDVEYFRAKPDVIVECNAQGEVLGASAPGAVDPRKAKSYRTYGERGPQPGSNGPMPPPPPTVAVGKASTGPPVPHVVAIPPGASAPLVQTARQTNPQATKQPPALPPPPPADRKARSDKARQVVAELEMQARSEPMSPVEEVGTDGKTQAQIPVKR